MAAFVMPDVTSRIRNVWLDLAVPSSLKEMGEFQAVIEETRQFCSAITSLDLPGLDELKEWVESAPKVWLSKCREAALDSVRVQLSQGKSCYICFLQVSMLIGCSRSRDLERGGKG
jgi:protein transport protein DSL1/ZW10